MQERPSKKLKISYLLNDELKAPPSHQDQNQNKDQDKDQNQGHIQNQHFEKYDLSTVISFCNNLSEENKSLIPFILIKYLAYHHLEEFVESAINVVNGHDNRPDAWASSCVNTSISLAIIFFGLEKTKKIRELFRIGNYSNHSFKLPSGENVVTQCYSLFDASATCDTGKDKDFQTCNLTTKQKLFFDKYKNAYETSYGTKTTQTKTSVLDVASKQALEKHMKQLKYDCNKYTIDTFTNDIESNKLKTNKNTSFIYWISINIFKSCFHTFLIEQFFSSKHQAVRYRIHQSWAKMAKLSEDIQKRNYKVDGENALTHPEMQQFIQDFYLMNSLDADPYLRQQAIIRCFNYGIVYKVYFFYDDILGATSVKYYSSEFKPADCIANLTTHLNSSYAGWLLNLKDLNVRKNALASSSPSSPSSSTSTSASPSPSASSAPSATLFKHHPSSPFSVVKKSTNANDHQIVQLQKTG